MKSIYSNTISENIQYDEVGGSTSKPFIKTQYYNDVTATWCDFEDVQGRTISLSNQNKRYGSFSFVPPSKELSLSLNNYESIYSTGSGNAKASILKKNLKIRCFTGYELSGTGSNSYTDDFTTGVKNYHTGVISGSLYATMSAASGTISKYADFNSYDRFDYGDRAYSAQGYYYKKYSFSSTAYDAFSSLKITSSSNKFSVKYRLGALGWSPYQALNTGANTININSPANAKSLEYIVRFEGTLWNTADRITAAKIFTTRKGYLFERGTFICDEPEYGDTVTVKGRDYLKKALETEISLPTYSNTNIGIVIKDIFDRCSIPYDTADWDTSGTTITVNSTLADELCDISGWKALDFAMDAINAGDDDWRLKSDSNGNLMLKKVPVASNQADATIGYFNNIESVSKNFDSDKQLQRITVMNKDVPVNSEHLIRTGTSGTVSWGTAALYVRYVDNVGNLATESYRSNTEIRFTFSNTATPNVSVYGCFPKNAITHEVWGERGNASNITKNDGQTYKMINPMLSASQCSALADYLIGLWSSPSMKIDLTMQSNPYLELNDNVMVFDKYTYTDDIYLINEIKEEWNEPSLKDTLTLTDRGVNLGGFIWDKNGHDSGANDLCYDKGFVWDQDLSIGGRDTRTYEKPTRGA